MVPLQLKDPWELFVERREPGGGALLYLGGAYARYEN